MCIRDSCSTRCLTPLTISPYIQTCAHTRTFRANISRCRLEDKPYVVWNVFLSKGGRHRNISTANYKYFRNFYFSARGHGQASGLFYHSFGNTVCDPCAKDRIEKKRLLCYEHVKINGLFKAAIENTRVDHHLQSPFFGTRSGTTMNSQLTQDIPRTQ